ncbi:Signal transduction histidine kinase [Promicromonospora umidemergens]|uniref:histidine kinase n=1 Tax=Promicromonospora umidemergens TaxID=629679 RepID=A0ABP8Y993_9MICO|nr:histidine kinase [Promicromonospora umidemergens]MCP2284763.1 Signal transduction histidine kinase [Promicromonospora umidemergens]
MTQPSEITHTEHTVESVAVRPAHVLVAVAFAVLLVLAGVSPWWMLVLAAAAAPLGLSPSGARLGVIAMAVAAGTGAVAVLAGWADLREVLVAVARGVVTGVLPWSVAIAWRARRAGEADAAMALLREQDAQRMRAETDLARQRLRLAGSLHDDLGHALSLVAVNLGRLELELERSTGTQDQPGAASARESVGLARRQVSDAVARLGASVQTLRTGLADDIPLAAVQADLDALVRDARLAGADVELTGSPRRDHLAHFGPAVVRVVQEGLTNALKHAAGQPVRVALAGGPDRLVVTVRSPLPGQLFGPVHGALPGDEPTATVGGTGIRSLIEHVHAAGGSVQAGPDDGDFVLRAELRPVSEDPAGTPITAPDEHGGAAAAPRPLDATSRGTTASGTASRGETARDARTVTHGLTRARRRGGALLLAAVLVPTAALVAVAAAIQLADHLDARRALIDPAAFARISVGDARSRVQPLLPAATLDPPSGADPECDYYSVTVDSLDDASGDAYRICWAADRVSSTDLVVGGAQ